MKNKKIFIWGSSGHGNSVLDLAQNVGLKKFCFIDDSKNAKKVKNYELIKGRQKIDFFLKKKVNNKDLFTVAIGSIQKVRYKIFSELKKKKLKLPTLIHKKSNISKTAKIQTGCQIFANTNIGPNTEIGECTIINNNSNVDHDCKIGKAVHIAPGAVLCGGVKVGDNSLIGANSTVLPYLKIGSNVSIGAGTVVTKNVPSNSIFLNKRKK